MPFSVLFFLFLQTVQTVLHITTTTTKNRGSQPLKKGTSSSLGWVEGHHINESSGVFYQVKVETFNIFFSFHLAKNHKKNLIFPKWYKVNKSGRVRFKQQNKREHIILRKHKNITNRRFHNSGQHSKGLMVNISKRK